MFFLGDLPPRAVCPSTPTWTGALQACWVLSATRPWWCPSLALMLDALFLRYHLSHFVSFGRFYYSSRGDRQYIFWDSFCFKMFSLHTWLIILMDIGFLVGSYFPSVFRELYAALWILMMLLRSPISFWSAIQVPCDLFFNYGGFWHFLFVNMVLKCCDGWFWGGFFSYTEPIWIPGKCSWVSVLKMTPGFLRSL